MPDLRFSVESVSATHDTGQRGLLFHLQVENSPAAEPVRSISLNTQVQIQPARRRYNDQEKMALLELFGEPERWATTLRPVFWAKASITVPPFQGSTIVRLPIPASSGLDDAASRYCHALREGDVPVDLLFSGTLFYVRSGTVQVAFIPWSKEASCRVPLATWRELAPLRFDAANAGGGPERTWEQILEHARALAGRSKP
jgi:hypothetical protein